MGLVAFNYYFGFKNTEKPVACTQEAKLCPDGSYVGRTGPNCEFALCPGEKEGILVNQPKAKVFLYYYNPEKDKDESSNIQCSRAGLVAVERKISTTKTPIQDTIKLLITGQLTEEEKSQGISSEYPLAGFSLKGALLKDGDLTLEFIDSQGKTTGGSCRVGILWSQIEATAKQFSEVDQVKFLPEDIFQP